jgi:hypothetical protein
VSRAAKNNAPAAKPCPTMQQPCNNKTTQRNQRPKNPPRPASAAKPDPATFQGGGHRPGETRSQKQGKTPVNASLTAPDAQLTQRSTTAAAAKQQTQTTPRAGDTQAKANQTTARKPKTHPCNNMHNYKRKHAADPERRARRKSSKKRSQTTKRTHLAGLSRGHSKVQARSGAPTTCAWRSAGKITS